MCQSKAQGGLRCSDSAKKALDEAIESGTPREIKSAKIEFLTSKAGIASLREQGRDDLAERFLARRKRLMENNKKQWRRSQNLAIALDLDNTTADFTGAFRASLAQKYGLSRDEAMEKYPEPIDYSFVKSGWFKDTNEFLSEFNEAEDAGLYKQMPIFTKARKTIQGLHQQGYTIHFVTARTPKFNDDTKFALRRYRLPYHLLKHTEDKENHDASLFFDDAPKQINTLTLHGKKVVAYDNRYNVGHEGVARVKSWAEISAVVEEYTSAPQGKEVHF